MEPTEKSIAFIDILGFSALTKAAEEGKGLTLQDLRVFQKMLGSENDRRQYEQSGPTICPEAPNLRKDLDFQIAQAFDSVVVSTEVSPAGLINLVSHCFGVCVKLLSKGVMCRGYIQKGKIHHDGLTVLGSGHVDAVAKEKEVAFWKRDAFDTGTPFIEIDPEVVAYVEAQSDKCVKIMFNRMTLTHNGLTAVFPIQRLSHSFGWGGYGVPPFDPAKEKRSNNVLRESIKDFRQRVLEFVHGADPKVVRKAEHYIRALDAQLEACDKTDEAVDFLIQPYPSAGSE